MEERKEMKPEDLVNVVGGRGGSSSPLPYRDGCIVYQIQRGDMLSKIARRFHTTVNNILSVNTTIYDRNNISAGDYIYVPD